MPNPVGVIPEGIGLCLSEKLWRRPANATPVVSQIAGAQYAIPRNTAQVLPEGFGKNMTGNFFSPTFTSPPKGITPGAPALCKKDHFMSIYNKRGPNPMAHLQHKRCIEACAACAEACEHCGEACLGEDDVAMMAECIRLDKDCSAVCLLAVAAMSRGSRFVSEICDLCASICEACADECAKHDADHCQRCAEACRACAEECRQMATMG